MTVSRSPHLLALFLALPGLSMLLPACDQGRRDGGGGGAGENSGDADSDGLSNSFEDAIGTDPQNVDTDGDGYSDAEEHLAYFDATDAGDWPYIGGYPRLPLPGSVASSGQGMDQVPQNFGGDDQHGQELRLHRFYGNVVLVEIGAGWCGPCAEAAPYAQADYLEDGGRGFVVIGVLIEDADYNSVSLDEQQQWADDLGLTYPVLGDYEFGNELMMGVGSQGLPTFVVLDRELRIDYVQVGFGGPQLNEAIDLLLDEPFPQADWPLPDDVDSLRDQLGIDVIY